MNLLFVDDDQRLLRALAQSLRSQRKRWELRFCDSAAAALEVLASWPCDAVITDMRMPALDGADLLKRVRSLQPTALRVVLSGQMSDAAAARAASLAHRFLAKPIATGDLVAILTRALDLREQFHSDEMRNCIGGLGTLPSLPKTCAALDHALRDDRTPLSEVAAIAEGDPALAAKVLQLVNSSFFGLSRHIVNVEQAIRYLGLSAVRSLLVANALFEQLAAQDTALLEAAQARALSVARYTRRFGLKPKDAELTATAGLLHNVGDVAIISRLPAEYRANLAFAEEHATSLAEAMRARMRVSQGEVGAYLLSLWGLPFEVIELVGTQGSAPPSNLELNPASVLWLATCLADEESLGELPAGHPLDEVAARLGVTPIVEAVRDEIAAACFARRAS